MAENQAAHRHSLELTVVRSNSKSQTLGVWFAGLVSLGVLGLASFLAATGMPLWGLSAVLFDLALLAGVFVYSKRVSADELSKKRTDRAEHRAATQRK